MNIRQKLFRAKQQNESVDILLTSGREISGKIVSLSTANGAPTESDCIELDTETERFTIRLWTVSSIIEPLAVNKPDEQNEMLVKVGGKCPLYGQCSGEDCENYIIADAICAVLRSCAYLQEDIKLLEARAREEKELLKKIKAGIAHHSIYEVWRRENKHLEIPGESYPE